MLTRVHIGNYRCLVDFELRPERFSLLLGPNGSGKSSLLDALHAIFRLVNGWSTADQAFPEWSRNRDEPDKPRTFVIEARVGSHDYTYSLEIVHDRAGRARVDTESIRRGAESLYQFADGVGALLGRDAPGQRTFPFDGRASPLAAFNIDDAPAIRPFVDWLFGLWVVRPVPQLMSSQATTEMTWLSPDLSNFGAWLRDRVDEDPRRASRIWKSLRVAIPGLDSAVFSRDTARSSTLRFTFKRRARGPAGPFGFALDELSDGQRMLIALYSLLHVVVGGGQTLIIDEPDNYVALPEIQPWLDELYDMVFERQAQVLIVSHHPRLTDLYAPKHGYWLDRKGTGPVRVRRIAAREGGSGVPISELVARGWVHE